MSRPRKGTEQVFYDTFVDFNIDDQVIVLRTLTELHQQAQRPQKKKPEPEQEQLTLKESAGE